MLQRACLGKGAAGLYLTDLTVEPRPTHLLEDEVAALACRGKVGIDLPRVVRHRDDRLHQSQVSALLRGQTNRDVL